MGSKFGPFSGLVSLALSLGAATLAIIGVWHPKSITEPIKQFKFTFLATLVGVGLIYAGTLSYPGEPIWLIPLFCLFLAFTVILALFVILFRTKKYYFLESSIVISGTMVLMTLLSIIEFRLTQPISSRIATSPTAEYLTNLRKNANSIKSCDATIQDGKDETKIINVHANTTFETIMEPSYGYLSTRSESAGSGGIMPQVFYQQVGGIGVERDLVIVKSYDGNDTSNYIYWSCNVTRRPHSIWKYLSIE